MHIYEATPVVFGSSKCRATLVQTRTPGQSSVVLGQPFSTSAQSHLSSKKHTTKHASTITTTHSRLPSETRNRPTTTAAQSTFVTYTRSQTSSSVSLESTESPIPHTLRNHHSGRTRIVVGAVVPTIAILALFMWLFIRYYIRGPQKSTNKRSSVVSSEAKQETTQHKLSDMPHSASLCELSTSPTHSKRIASATVVDHKPTSDAPDLGITNAASLKSSTAADDPSEPRRCRKGLSVSPTDPAGPSGVESSIDRQHAIPLGSRRSSF